MPLRLLHACLSSHVTCAATQALAQLARQHPDAPLDAGWGAQILQAAVGDPATDRLQGERHGLSCHFSQAELGRLLELLRLADVAALP